MNIQTTLTRLSEHGLSDAQIGRRIDAPQSIVTRLRRGTHKTTSYERGSRIAALYREVFGDSPVGGAA